MKINAKALGVGIALLLFAAIQFTQFRLPRSTVPSQIWGVASACKFSAVPQIELSNDVGSSTMNVSIRFGKFQETRDCRIVVVAPGSVQWVNLMRTKGSDMEIQRGEIEHVPGIEQPVERIRGPSFFAGGSRIVTPSPGAAPSETMNFNTDLSLRRIGFGLYGFGIHLQGADFGSTTDATEIEFVLNAPMFESALHMVPAPTSTTFDSSLKRAFFLGPNKDTLWMLLLLPEREYLLLLQIVFCLMTATLAAHAIVFAFISAR